MCLFSGNYELIQVNDSEDMEIKLNTTLEYKLLRIDIQIMTLPHTLLFKLEMEFGISTF